MIKKFISALILFIGITPITYAQKNYPKNDFISPLGIPLFLSGNFGELRGSHFHAGLDLKTQGVEGKKVYATADGYISRIKVGLCGYGKVLYIAHPNGYTTVYAHLSKFNTAIESYIKKLQYQRKSYEINIYLKPNQFPVKQGEYIADSGNTGGSGGPHLHYEIRETSTQNPINPLHFGYSIADHIAPAVYRLMVYPLSSQSQVEGSQLAKEVNITKQADGSYLADSVKAFGTIGFGIQTIDQQDGSYNKNGTYQVTFSANGTTYSDCIFDELSFSESRYLLELIDYPLWVTQKSKVHLAYKTDGNRLSTIYKKMKHNGTLSVQEGMSYQVQIVAKDFEGNTTKIVVPVQGKNMDIQEFKEKKEGKLLVAERDAYFKFDNGNVYFPKNTFFKDEIVAIDSKNDTVYIGDPTIPVKKYYNLSILYPNHLSESEKNQSFIASIDSYGNPSYENTIRKDEYASARTRSMGPFVLMQDTIAPKIEVVNIKNGGSMKGKDKLVIKISDDLSGIKKYTPLLNGKWILMEYEPKKNELTFDFSDLENYPTNNTLKLEVEDNVGNKNVLELNFLR